jgi:AcrR family transcriptional regulator
MFTLGFYMLAKKSVQDKLVIVKRDKKAKIISIQDSMCMLIATKGYENVTVRDIAKAAGVSIGLIYKYFPGGKFEILKEISSRNTGELLMIKKPEEIDNNDFPGYIRNVISNMLQYTKDNSSLSKALILSALLDGEIMDDYKKMDKMDFEYKQHKAASEFFCRFKGVEIGNEDSLEVFTNWGIMVDSIILFNTIYPLNLIRSEESLIDLMVDLSLKMWGYQAP